MDLTVFNHIMDAQGFTESEYMALQGIYTGKYDPLINVPMSIPYALSTSIVPALTTVVMARNRKKDTLSDRSDASFNNDHNASKLCWISCTGISAYGASI